MPELCGNINDYLAYSAWRGVRFLHPGGAAVTGWLLDALRVAPGTTTLEIGVGTGATAALVAERTGSIVVGVDRLPPMLSRARELGAASGVGEQIILVRADAERGLPFRDATFDAVYAESVVGLLDVERVVPECARVLRRGGRLGLNDGIWRPGLTQAEVDEQNEWNLRAFGIRSATTHPLDHEDWVRLIERAGLEVEVAARIDDLPAGPPTRGPSERELRRYVRRPKALARRLRFDYLVRQGRRYSGRMEAWVFVARKPDGVR